MMALSFSLTYLKGRLVYAVTRGDEKKGMMLRPMWRHQSIPLTLTGNNYPDEFEIGVKFICPAMYLTI